MQVVIERLALAQEFRRIEDIVAIELRLESGGITDRHCGFDDHQRLRVDHQHVLHNRFDGARIETIGFRVVICWSGDEDEVSVGVGFSLIERGPEIQRFIPQVVLDFSVFNR